MAKRYRTRIKQKLHTFKTLRWSWLHWCRFCSSKGQQVEMGWKGVFVCPRVMINDHSQKNTACIYSAHSIWGSKKVEHTRPKHRHRDLHLHTVNILATYRKPMQVHPLVGAEKLAGNHPCSPRMWKARTTTGTMDGRELWSSSRITLVGWKLPSILYKLGSKMMHQWLYSTGMTNWQAW